MKITGLLVLKCNPEGTDPVILANATDVSRFNIFQRSSVREIIVFSSRTVATQTPPGKRGMSQQEEYKVHSYNRNGLCVVGFMDDHYPDESAFSLLNQVLDEYQKNFGDSWRTVQADSTQPWPYLNQALTKFQDPAEADKLLKIKNELDQTKNNLDPAEADKLLKIKNELDQTKNNLDPAEADKLLKIKNELDQTKNNLLKTVESVLERGEKLDSLIKKSSDLSAASRVFYEQAQQTNQCCTIL